MFVDIADLYPYEHSNVLNKIRRQEKKLKKNQAEPIEVLPIDEDLLVINGNNTAFAAKRLGRTKIEAEFVGRSNYEMRAFRDGLAQAKMKNQKGFNNWPIDPSLYDRAKRYES